MAWNPASLCRLGVADINNNRSAWRATTHAASNRTRVGDPGVSDTAAASWWTSSITSIRGSDSPTAPSS